MRHRRIAGPGLVGDNPGACGARSCHGPAPGPSGARRRGHLVRRRGRGGLRSPPTGGHRPLAGRPPAHGLGRRPLGRLLQRRVLQRRRAAGRAARRRPGPQGPLRHRGGGGGGGRLGPAPDSRAAGCHVRPGPVGPPGPRPAPDPGPPGREAAVLLNRGTASSSSAPSCARSSPTPVSTGRSTGGRWPSFCVSITSRPL